MPATAAIDNETLDHLLSVVDEGNQYSAPQQVAMSRRKSASRNLWKLEPRRDRGLSRQPIRTGGASPCATFSTSPTATEDLNPHEGLDLLGNAAAREEAVRLARDIKRGKLLPGQAQGQSFDGWFIRIVDQHGKEVDTVPLDAVPDGPEVPVP